MATEGQKYECRVARLLHHEGALVRRAVDLQLHFGEKLTVTDIDVLAISFSPTLRRHVTVCECKTGTGKSAPSAGDRLLWSTGVRHLVPRADHHMVAMVKSAKDTSRQLARRLGAELVDERDLARRESVLGLDRADLSGPHDPIMADLSKRVVDFARRDDELKRVSDFVVSEFWFSDTVYGLKRALGALRLLGRRWHENLPDDEGEAVRWLVHETLVATVVALADLAGASYRQPSDVFTRDLNRRLAEGVASYEALEAISSTVDQYLVRVLRQAGLDPTQYVGALGALNPEPPAYAEPLAEVLHRLAAAPRATAELGRLVDERLAALRGSPVPTSAPSIPEARRASLLLMTVATFLKAQVKLPDELVKPLANGSSETGATHPGSTSGSAPTDSRTSSSDGADSSGSPAAEPSPESQDSEKRSRGASQADPRIAEDPKLFPDRAAGEHS